MWSDGVVVNAPFLDQDLGLLLAVEQFTIEQLVAEPGVEAFTVSIFPGRSRFDVSSIGAHGSDPVPHFQANKSSTG